MSSSDGILSKSLVNILGILDRKSEMTDVSATCFIQHQMRKNYSGKFSNFVKFVILRLSMCNFVSKALDLLF